MWPNNILPDISQILEPDRLLLLHNKALRELQFLSQGRLSFGSVDEPGGGAPNTDTAVIEIVESAGNNILVDNPLGREPVGVINVMSITNEVGPRVIFFNSSVSITQGTTTVTTTDTFSADLVGGYFISSARRYKIASWTNATTLELQDAFEEATMSAENGTFIYRWEADSVWLYLGGMKGFYGYYRLLFF
jgi:hypothetical protein